MKKNKTLRIALVLCVLAIFCACLVGSTFAKYVTSDNSADTARVSKWGVVVTAANNSNFLTEYTTDDSTYADASSLSVKASNGNNMVAPGTKDDQGIEFTITGTPEVAAKMQIDMVINSDVYLGTAGYGAQDNGSYYPVVFTLTQTSNATGGMEVEIAKGNLYTIKAALDAYNTNLDQSTYTPNTVLDATFKLTWEWVYDVDTDPATDGVQADATIDKNDTILGDLGAGVLTNVPDEYKTATEGIATGNKWCDDISYTLTFTITQVN